MVFDNLFAVKWRLRDRPARPSAYMRGREAFRDAKSTHRPGPVPLLRARSVCALKRASLSRPGRRSPSDCTRPLSGHRARKLPPRTPYERGMPCTQAHPTARGHCNRRPVATRAERDPFYVVQHATTVDREAIVWDSAGPRATATILGQCSGQDLGRNSHAEDATRLHVVPEIPARETRSKTVEAM